MMGNTKKEFKWFTITQYKQEEEYLSSMHRKGWRFTKVIFPGIYSFEECEPENVTYRLDYNQDGIANKAEYVQMFSDCGLNILVRRSRQSGVARATNPDFESHRLLLILLVSDLNHILLA